MSLQTYALIIQYSSAIAVNGSKRGSIFLNCVDDVTVNEDSEITTHPMVNGDLIADHMVKQPISLSFSGSASLNGSNGSMDIFNIDQEGSFADAFAIRDLTQFENIFSEIKNVGALCTISKISQTETPCFRTYKNLALNSISFTEKINSVNFTFSFTQVMLADVQELQADTTDQFLPSITDANELSFVDTFINWEEMYMAVEQACFDTGLISEEFRQAWHESGNAALQGTALAVTGGALLYSILSTAAAAQVVPGVGQVVGAGLLAVGGLYWAYKGVSNAITRYKNKQKYREEQFQYYGEDNKDRKEAERFANFISNVMLGLYTLNDKIRVLTFPIDGPQQCMLTIADEYYIFDVYENKIMSQLGTSTVELIDYFLNIKDMNNKIYASAKPFTSANISYDACTSSNALFRSAVNGAYVHLVKYNNLSRAFIPSTCAIVVSGFKPEDLWNEINETIRKELLWNPNDE